MGLKQAPENTPVWIDLRIALSKWHIGYEER